MNLDAALRAWQDLLLPGAFRIVLKGVAFAIVALTVMAFTLAWAIGLVVPADVSLPWIGETDAIHALAGWAAFGLVVFASVFLMVPVASIFTGFFLEDVAELVEGAHYPTLPKVVAPQPLLDSLVKTLKFFGVVIAANLLALLIYPVRHPLRAAAVSGAERLSAGARVFPDGGRAADARSAGPRALSAQPAGDLDDGRADGAAALGALRHLVVPVVGAAAFTHLFHRLARHWSSPAPSSGAGTAIRPVPARSGSRVEILRMQEQHGFAMRADLRLPVPRTRAPSAFSLSRAAMMSSTSKHM